MRHRRGAVLLMLAGGLLLLPPSAAADEPASGGTSGVAVAPLQSAEGDLTVCRDVSGEPRTGALDVLLLIDDSGSLEATNNPTDPDKRRFTGLRVLLDGLSAQSDDARAVNIAAVTFGERVSVELEFQPLERAGVGTIIDDLQRVATGRQRLTTYDDGLRRAIDLLSTRPAENCRFLVFFTDGGHDPSNDRSPTADARDAAALREGFCRPGGLGDRLVGQGINLFVLLLTPATDNPERLEASKDVMQVLTGDRTPGFDGPRGTARIPSGPCADRVGPQTGLILPVSEAAQLPGIFADLPNIGEGGVAPLPCPYRVGTVETGALPDGHLVDWISLTDYSATTTPAAPDLRDIVIITGGQRVDAATLMEPLSESAPSARFRLRESARPTLQAGWTLEVGDAENLCLRMRPIIPEFRISTTEPRVRAVSPRGLPEPLFEEGRLEFRDLSTGAAVSLDAALRTPRVGGRLLVEYGELFAPTGYIPARIAVDGAPVRSGDCSEIQIPAPGSVTFRTVRGGGGGLEAPESPLRSSSCTVTPATLGDGGVISWQRTLAELNAADFGCPVGEWSAWVDGAPTDEDLLELPVGGQPVSIEFRSAVPPTNEAIDCTGVLVTPIELSWQGRPAEIPVTLSVSWLRRSSLLIAAFIATPAALLAIMLSLGLLWLVNEFWANPPEASKLWGYEARGRLEVDGRGRTTVLWDEGGSTPVITSETLKWVGTFGRGGLRTDGDSRLARRMPPLFRPLSEPVLELVTDGSEVTVSHPPAPIGRGALPMEFREAVLLRARAGRVPEPGFDVPVRLTILVPKESDIAGSEAIGQVLDRHLDQLVDRLLERLREAPRPTPRGRRSGPEVGDPSVPPPTQTETGNRIGEPPEL